MDRLGAGGMAEVFRALVLGPEQFQRVVVVKRILPNLCANPSFIKMFIDEATLCGRLSHPNIIQVHEFGRYGQDYFIAMEYLHGRSLNNVLGRLIARSESLPVNIAADIMRQVCRGLAYAHGLKAMDGKPLGIIHRDVTPGNVIVAYTGVVKVVDFGVARVENRFRLGSTDPGHVKGKSSYLAPEQLSGERVDHRADIFSAGILLHEMLTGMRLFKAENPMDTMGLVRSMPIPPPSQHNPQVPPRLDAIVMRALERRRNVRYQDAGEMAEELEAFLIEQRFASQELPGFMRSLFQDDSASPDLQLDSTEIAALTAGDAAAGTGDQLSTGTGDVMLGTSSSSASAGASATPRPCRRPWLTGPTWSWNDTPSTGRRRLLLPAGVAALAVLATVGVVMTVGRPAGGPTGVKESVGASTPTPMPSAHPVAPAPAPALAPPSASLVKISISSEPAGAIVVQDDNPRPVGVTPLELILPRDNKPVVLRISKPGHVEGVLTLVPDRDRPALVTLARAADPGRRPSGSTQSPKTEKVRNAVPIDPFAQ